MGLVHADRARACAAMLFAVILPAPAPAAAAGAERFGETARVGIAGGDAEALTAAAGACSAAVVAVAAVPATRPPARAHPDILAQADRDFSLLDFAAARAHLQPWLAELRGAQDYGSDRRQAETLAAGIAEFERRTTDRDTAIRALAIAHLFAAPDPARIPPAVIRDLEEERAKMYAGPVTVVRPQPPPRAVVVAAMPAPATEFTLPLRLETLPIWVDDPSLGWLGPLSPAEAAYPQNNSAFVVERFPPSLAWIWIESDAGPALVSARTWKSVWRPGEAVDMLCAALHGRAETPRGVAAALVRPGGDEGFRLATAPHVGGPGSHRESSEKSRSLRQPWLWTGLAVVAGGAAAAAAIINSRQRRQATGTILIRW